VCSSGRAIVGAEVTVLTSLWSAAQAPSFGDAVSFESGDHDSRKRRPLAF
jgi:hypothetical protein